MKNANYRKLKTTHSTTLRVVLSEIKSSRRTNYHEFLKTQSITEYIITLAAIVVAIIAGTVGLRRGVETSLNTTHQALENNLSAPAEGQTKDLTALYGEPEQYTGNQTHEGYYFHEGDSDMSRVPPNGTIIETNDNPWGQ
ncbi:MAG: hypothetical protein PHQ96_04040 [Candidatus Omnitrophica bacterium]|nr:hypothetical protein [Candidatus Omnitrophota bacterium]